MDPNIGISPREFCHAFPFHLVFNHSLEILQTGDVIRRLCPGLIAGSRLSDHFTLVRPLVEMNFEEIRHDG
jgi:hypothetical protein